MGFKTEFNWVLKLKEVPEELIDGREYEFVKNEHRVYPIDIPIKLVGPNWEELGTAIIKEYTVGYGKTKGKFVYKK